MCCRCRATAQALQALQPCKESLCPAEAMGCSQAAMERDLQLQEAQLLAAQDKAADAAFGKMMHTQLQQVPPSLFPLIRHCLSASALVLITT